MTCIALDDEPLALSLLKHYVERVDWLEARGFFTDPRIAHSCIERENIDLLFLDIQMPDLSGLQFFSTLKKKPMVIFSTAYRQYAVEGFELNAIDYIVKPFEFERFQKAIYKALDYQRFLSLKKEVQNGSLLNNFIFVKSEYRVLKINLDDLYLIDTLDDYLRLHLTSEKRPILTLMTLKEMTGLLPEDRFLRVHRSYLVAVDKISSIRRKKLQVGNREIPVGVTYQEKVKAFFGQ